MSHIDDWLYSALPNEKKGLFILSKVHRHKGQKFFKTQMRKTKEELDDINNLSMAEALKRYQNKLNFKSTTYGHFYCNNQDQKYKFDNILEHKQFTKVN